MESEDIYLFSPGQADLYANSPIVTWPRGDAALHGELVRLYGAELAAEVAALYAQPDAFAG